MCLQYLYCLVGSKFKCLSQEGIIDDKKIEIISFEKPCEIGFDRRIPPLVYLMVLADSRRLQRDGSRRWNNAKAVPFIAHFPRRCLHGRHPVRLHRVEQKMNFITCVL